MVLPGASYARISDNDGAGAGVGCADQHRRNRKRAKAEGIEIAYEFTDDDRSAFKEDVVRDDYQRLLLTMCAGKIRWVLVKHADRLHRQNTEAEDFIKLARQYKVVVITASGLRYYLDTADGRKNFRHAATDASYESEHRGERISEWHERAALEGQYRGGAMRPFGWGVPTGVMRRVRDKKTGQHRDIEILDMTKHRQDEATEIRRWADELLSNISTRQVRLSTTIPTVTGGKWSTQSIIQIVTAPRVSGHSVYQGEIVKWNAWEPIIPEDKRQALIAKFEDPSRRTSPGNTPRWLGSCIYFCGICFYDPEVTDLNEVTMRVFGRVRGHQSYRCRRKGHCARVAQSIDQYVGEGLIARLARDDTASLIPQHAGVDTKAIHDQITILKQRKIKAGLMFAEDDDEDALVATKAALNAQIAQLQAELAPVATTSPLTEFENANTIAEAVEVWDGCTLGRQREILRTLATVLIKPPKRGRRFGGKDPLMVDDSIVDLRWVPFADTLASNGKLVTT